jgi:hypothetical protein
LAAFTAVQEMRFIRSHIVLVSFVVQEVFLRRGDSLDQPSGARTFTISLLGARHRKEN